MEDAQTGYPWQRPDKDAGHLRAGKIAAREHEGADPSGNKSRLLRLPIADSRVLRQDSPTPLADSREPVIVRGVGGEMSVMGVDLRSFGTQGLGNGRSSQCAIDEERWWTRRLRAGVRSGSLPGFQVRPVRSPGPDLRSFPLP